MGKVVVQLGLHFESLQQFPLFFVCGYPVEMQEVVHADAMGAGHETVHGDITLQGARCPDPYDLQGTQILPDFPCFEVYIGKGIHFVEDNVDIVRTDAGGNHGYPFVADIPGMGDEFPVLVPVFDRIEMAAHPGNPIRVTHGYHRIRQFLGAQVEVIDSTAFVYDEFRSADMLHT
jgi:hypothetical protein